MDNHFVAFLNQLSANHKRTHINNLLAAEETGDTELKEAYTNQAACTWDKIGMAHNILTEYKKRAAIEEFRNGSIGSL